MYGSCTGAKSREVERCVERWPPAGGGSTVLLLLIDNPLIADKFSLFQKDFIVLGLVDGKVTLLANAGNTPLTLQTDRRFNDGEWHFVSIHLDGTS